MTSWERVPLGELCEVLDNKRKPVTKSDRISGDVPYYGATGIQDYVADFIFDEKLVLLGEDGAKWAAGDKSAFIVEGKTWVNNHAHVLRPNRTRLLDEWLTYYLVMSDLSDYVTGVTVPKLNQGRMREILIPLPPVETQARLLKELEQSVSLIDELELSASKKAELSKELFAAFVGEKVASVEIDYGVFSMGDLFQIARGGSPRPIKSFITSEPDGINWIKIGDATRSGKYIDSTREKIKPSGALRSRRVSSGDLLLSNSMSFGRPYILKTDGCIHDGWVVLTAKEEVDSEYAYYVLGSNYMKSQFSDLAQGSTVQNLNIDLISRARMPLPPIAEQKALVSIFQKAEAFASDFDSLQSTSASSIAELRQIAFAEVFEGVKN
jgi:type I restriction enzyme S subunit